jgi:hypothetical protein
LLVDADAALAMVDRIYRRLNHRRPDIETSEKFYRGEQPLTFATQEWRQANADRYAGFADNWAGPVVNAEAERIRYTGLVVPGIDGAGKSLHEDWLRNELDMQSSQGIITTLTARRSFVIVWGDRDDKAIVSWEHPSNVEIEYDFSNPRLRKAALKTWVDEDYEYATLYEPDAVWKFQRGRVTVLNDFVSQAEQAKTGSAYEGGWQPRLRTGDPTWPLANPMGVTPVVEVPNRPTLMGDPISEIQGVIPMQNAINLLWAYLLLSADYASMDARVVLGSAPPMIPILDKDGKQIGEKPADVKALREKRLLYITGEDTKIDSWKAAQLDVFTSTIDVAVGHISSQTRTPPTYLVTKVGMSNVSADGLKASEIPLNKKVGEFWLYADVAFREINRLIALARGDEALAAAVQLAKITHENPEIRSESQLADALLKKKQMGYPFEYLLELDGVAPEDVERILAMKKAEDDANLQFGIHAAIDGEGAGPVEPAAPDVAAV